MSKQLHVVFGAGQVGARLAQHLQSEGHRVRVVRRSDRPVAAGIEVVAADAMNASQATEASAGAHVIYHCMNPSEYSGEAWSREFPVMGEALIGAALAHDARLVCLDNVYGYGVTEGARTEQTPMGATGDKGIVRAAWDARLHEAGADEGLRWTAGRAGDFFGPGTGDQSLFNTQMAHGLASGKPALLLARPSQPHSFSFVPDVVEGLVSLGTADDDVQGRAWHLPVHTLPPRELVTQLATAQGSRGWAITLPGWLLRGLGPIIPLFASLSETLYQWDRPFHIDDSDFRARFPGVGATLAEAIALSVQRAEAYGSGAAAAKMGRTVSSAGGV